MLSLKTMIKIIKIAIDIGFVLLGVALSLIYFSLFSPKKIDEFLAYSGIVFGSLVAITSLVLRYEGMVYDTEKKTIVRDISRNLLHGTLYFMITGLSGVIALKIGEIDKYLPLPQIGMVMFIVVGSFYLMMSWRFVYRSLDALIDYLWAEEFGEENTYWFGVKVKPGRLRKEKSSLQIEKSTNEKEEILIRVEKQKSDENI